MIVPSIDLMNGQAVQLIGGKEKALDAGDPLPLAQKFAPVGEVAVIDLDAALGTGSNAAQIQSILSMARCRVGGGIRTVEAARAWLDAGVDGPVPAPISIEATGSSHRFCSIAPSAPSTEIARQTCCVRQAACTASIWCLSKWASRCSIAARRAA
jgi:phosphoribosylformimino-5-aminoimidazole carboxamide ribonucleotide (ProFAR) isomerase